MECAFGPNHAEVPTLLYILQRKIKVFNTTDPLSNRGYNLVASSSKYGLVFIGSPDGTLSVYQLRDLVDKNCEPQHATVKLQERPTHIAVSSDQELLAVTGGQLLSIFNIANFQNPNPQSLDIRCEVNPATFVSGLQWNPCNEKSLAMIFYDGTLLVANIGVSPPIKKVQSKARCLCWSPKGKQLVTGNNDGTLAQYTPDLAPAKVIPAPNLFEGAPVEALAVYWISTRMFAVVYRNAADNSRPVVTVVNTPKTGPSQCLNYEDICYSTGTNRPWYYYLLGLPQWHIIMASSSNSMEIATLGSETDGNSWIQWCQSDEARPELPLTNKKIENFPVGVSIDTCAIHQLPWGENSTLPFMPLLHVLSHNGLLTIFNVINLNNKAPQICTPPQQLALPAVTMTSTIPGEAPAPAPAPAQPAAAPVQPQVKPQEPPVAQPQPAQPPPQYTSVINVPKPPSYTQQPNQGFAPAAQPEQKAVPEPKPTPVQPKPTPAPVVQPQPIAPKAQTAQQAQEAAALKAEQERINEMKANQELKNMLVQEVNDFQMELYKFMVKTRETQAKLQRDMDSINKNYTLSIDSEQLKKECSLDDLRVNIMQLKLELVRACAVVAEARTHAEAKDQHQWTKVDPLTTKRVASVKKLAYYVQNQLEQAQKALNYKWNEAASKDNSKPGQRMIRPILDDVYQPLVKQQEILSRQQAVLRTLKNTLKECEVTPMFKSNSLLRSTPFKKDPLSKLTKNILNMSIEPEKPKEPLLSSQKLDALRDMLSNHKTVKIKPVNVEMRQHLANMRMNYQKNLKEKAQAATTPAAPQIKTEAQQPQPQPAFVPKVEVKIEFKQDSKPAPISIPSFTPVGSAKPAAPALANVARTLFTDEPSKPVQAPQAQQKPVQSAFAQQYSPITPVTPPSNNTRSMLKDMLQSKQSLPNFELKGNDSNTFMGQPICSPFSFSSSSAAVTAAGRTSAFTSQPTSDTSNIFSKFQTQPAFSLETTKPKPVAFAPETKPTVAEAKSTTSVPSSQSSETGELETTITKTVVLKSKPDKQMTSIFGAGATTSTANMPDVLKEVKSETKTVKPGEKENVPQKGEVKAAQKPVDKKEAPKPLAVQANKPLISATPQPVASSGPLPTDTKPAQSKPETKVEGAKVPEKPVTPASNASSIFATAEAKPAEVKPDLKVEALKVTEKSAAPVSSASSIFAAGNATVASVPKPTPLTISAKSDTTTTKSEPVTPASTPTEVPSSKSIFASTGSSTAASVFGAAIASQVKTTSTTGSIFGSPSSASSIFGQTGGSIFGTPQTSESTTQSDAKTKPIVFSTPTPSSPTQDSPSIFAAEKTTQPEIKSIFGTSIFATASTTQSTSLFGSTNTVFASTATSTPSVFSSVSSSPASVFSSAVTASTPSAFTATTTQASLFGTNTAATTQVSVFGSTSAASTPASVFGSTTTPTTPTSLFGSTTVASTQAPLFGSTTTPTTQASLFGSNTAATTQASLFGSTTPTTKASLFSTPGSVFGSGVSNANQTSVFGQQGSTQASSVFGSVTATTQAPAFGVATSAAPASVFGAAPVTTQASVFGGGASVFSTPATTAQSTSLFGGNETSMFASASISNEPAQSTGSIFGGSSPGSVFGSSGTNVFASKTGFGQSNQTAASIFGGGGATTFGQKPATSFWSGGNSNTESGFGSSGGAFGQQATTQASSIFGGTTGGSFSTPSPGAQPFGSPQQGSVFGSPQQQPAAAPGGFGSSPVFGGNKPVFGSTTSFSSPTSGFGAPAFGGFNKSPSNVFGAPAFGGGATFGGGAAFGSTSPGKVFGGAAPASAFTSTQSNATFESLANQNTLTFGNLAQQSGQPQQQQPPSYNTSPSFTGWRA